jgi:hypothetical protein
MRSPWDVKTIWDYITHVDIARYSTAASQPSTTNSTIQGTSLKAWKSRGNLFLLILIISSDTKLWRNREACNPHNPESSARPQQVIIYYYILYHYQWCYQHSHEATNHDYTAWAFPSSLLGQTGSPHFLNLKAKSYLPSKLGNVEDC